MLANMYLYLSSCALLFPFLCHVSMGTPVPQSENPAITECQNRVNLSRELVGNIRALLDNEDLFVGLNCSEQRVEVNPKTETVQACKPNTDMSACLRNISEDLRHYVVSLKAYKQAQTTLNSTVILTDKLLHSCITPDVETSIQLADSKLTSGNSVDQRVHLCKVLKGFYLRIITISRAIGYISAGDHKK
ncbi:hypothetical protein DPEC_G00241460 [Dallia pectoralis]|uniref:Uncharacterized protein n=1 Tax=Dallia pectoralis TaxID=75939 RepID=A0ACC2FUP3_DALPE|nr:hypothetical protein DPEC_G00241460 [Dallia pectoralis]